MLRGRGRRWLKSCLPDRRIDSSWLLYLRNWNWNRTCWSCWWRCNLLDRWYLSNMCGHGLGRVILQKLISLCLSIRINFNDSFGRLEKVPKVRFCRVFGFLWASRRSLLLLRTLYGFGRFWIIYRKCAWSLVAWIFCRFYWWVGGRRAAAEALLLWSSCGALSSIRLTSWSCLWLLSWRCHWLVTSILSASILL